MDEEIRRWSAAEHRPEPGGADGFPRWSARASPQERNADTRAYAGDRRWCCPAPDYGHLSVVPLGIRRGYTRLNDGERAVGR